MGFEVAREALKGTPPAEPGLGCGEIPLGGEF